MKLEKRISRACKQAATVEYVADSATGQLVPRPVGDKRFTARRIWVN